MKISTYESIFIPPHATYESAHDPLRIYCSDNKTYIVKANRTNHLFFDFGFYNEFICSFFLFAWNISTPNFAGIQVDSELIKKAELPSQYNPKYYKNICFGSENLNMPIDFMPRSFNVSNRRFIKQYHDSFELLKIGLFDFWVHNTDRRPNHSNLMLQYPEMSIFAIDHYHAFNASKDYSSLSHNLVLSDDNTIINTKLARSIWATHEDIDIDNLKKYFATSIKVCRLQFETFIQTIENLTKFNISSKKELASFLFNKKRNKIIFDKYTALLI